MTHAKPEPDNDPKSLKNLEAQSPSEMKPSSTKNEKSKRFHLTLGRPKSSNEGDLRKFAKEMFKKIKGDQAK